MRIALHDAYILSQNMIALSLYCFDVSQRGDSWSHPLLERVVVCHVSQKFRYARKTQYFYLIENILNCRIYVPDGPR